MGRRERDDAEFAEFMAARGTHLYRSALLLTGRPHAAEDLAQATLARAYASWRRVRAADDPVAYVHRMLVNTFLSRRRRRSSTELPVAQTPDVAARPDGVDHADRLALLASLATLAPLDRAVVVGRYWEDRSLHETAVALGLTEAAVKNRSLRALRRLREQLSDPVGPVRPATTPGDPA
ncbi:SigE family RNA polymerase sigma factor [Nocardioides marinquilinus]|uniref:SigE family RNA polymerase sigma factor n=1 Tax=Nocardioides marinquilinus TaxID=1210400 RepID=A0ABP9PCP4_9ACTN